MERFSDRILLDPQAFERIYFDLSVNRSFDTSRHDTATVRYRRISGVEEAVLRTVEDCTSASSRAVVCAVIMSHFLS